MENNENNDRYLWLGPFMRCNPRFEIRGKEKATLIDYLGLLLPWVWNLIVLLMIPYIFRLFF